ncbi:MAG: hypothetical protein AAF614_23035 [Chloroflexota bacterium]
MTQNVLFLCPHGAAKSVFAMTYFNALAAQAGLDAVATNAGTEPDLVVSPKVSAYLAQEGFDVADFVPRLLTDADLKTADLVVSLGCLTADAIPADTRCEDWSDVPLPSQAFQASRDQTYQHVAALVADLATNGI